MIKFTRRSWFWTCLHSTSQFFKSHILTIVNLFTKNNIMQRYIVKERNNKKSTWKQAKASQISRGPKDEDLRKPKRFFLRLQLHLLQSAPHPEWPNYLEAEFGGAETGELQVQTELPQHIAVKASIPKSPFPWLFNNIEILINH